MLTPFSLMDDICNRKTLSLVGTSDFSDLGLGKYMFNRWLSMTNPKNALVASEVMNSYWFPDDGELLYDVATLFSVRCGRFKYSKKGREKKNPEKSREWGDEVTERERKMYGEFMDDLEGKAK